MLARLVLLAAVAALLFVTSAKAADPAVTCNSGKLKIAGKYAACLLSADSKAVKTNTPADYTRCDDTLALKWSSAETKAGTGVCPGGDGDQAAIGNFVDKCDQAVAAALAGTTSLPADPIACDSALTTCNGDLATCGTDLATCEALVGPLKTGQTTCYDTAGSFIACAGSGQDGELQKGVARSFTDNGNGTISDNVTGLMWEKLSNDGTIHDVDDTYTWENAFATKVATLNSTSFGGHADWRVPNRAELETLLAGATISATAGYPTFQTPGCPLGCTVLTCSCTISGYWSSTTNVVTPSVAWNVNFGDAGVNGVSKSSSSHVRAVRGGS